MWEPGREFEAECAKGGTHAVPDPHCTCGLYAAATFNRLFDMGYTKTDGLFGAPEGVVTIAGQVALWGGIIPGNLGWRAQFAYPHKLLVPYSHWKIAKGLAETYDVPFKLYNLERKH
jgi:hypothetical protein